MTARHVIGPTSRRCADHPSTCTTHLFINTASVGRPSVLIRHSRLPDSRRTIDAPQEGVSTMIGSAICRPRGISTWEEHVWFPVDHDQLTIATSPFQLSHQLRPARPRALTSSSESRDPAPALLRGPRCGHLRFQRMRDCNAAIAACRMTLAQHLFKTRVRVARRAACLSKIRGSCRRDGA